MSGVVSYIPARDNLLATLFFLASVILYILYKEAYFKKYNLLLYLGSFLAFLLALLSREVSFVIPFVILLYLYCFDGKNKAPQKSQPSLLWLFFIALAIYAYLRSTVLNFAGERLLETTTGQVPLYLRLLTTSKVLMIYLRLLLFPTGLHMEWNIKPATSFMQDEAFLSVVGLCIIAVFTYVLSRTSKLKFFAIGWFLITLVPYSNIFPLAYFMGEGWLYIPSVGFFALAAIYLSELMKRSKLWSITVIRVVIFTVACYGFLTLRRADVWADPVKLYTEILKYSPDSSKARINLGVVLAESGSHEKAMERYQEAAKLAPTDSGIRANIGVVYADKNKYDAALEEFKKAVELNPEDYVAHMNIGIVYKKQGDFKKALEEYQKAISLNPNYPLAYNNIGNTYLETGQYDEAIGFYKKAIGIDPNNAPFYSNLGKAYKNKEMPIKARESFEKALQLDPNHRDAVEGLESLN